MTGKKAVKLDLTDPFLGGDVQLDLSGFPQYERAVTGDSTDPFLGEDTYLVEENRSSLKKGILSLANQRDTEVAGHLQRAGIEDLTAPKTFYLASGEQAKVYLDSDNAWRVAVFFADQTQKTFKFESATSRESAQMMAAKEVAQTTARIRELTQAESLYVVRLCHRGNIADALANYVFYRCGEIDHDPTDDPRYIGVLNDCAWFCFEHMTPTFSESAREFMQQYLANRTVINLPILTAAFKAYEIEQAKANRPSLLPKPSENTEIDIESLSDQEIAQLREAAMHEYAKQRRVGD